MKPSDDPAAQPPPAPDEHEVWLPISTAPKGQVILVRERAYPVDDVYAARLNPEGHWSSFCGQPVVTAPEPDEWTEMPGIGASMPLDPELVEGIKRLVGDIEVDLDAPLPDDQD